VLEPVWRSGVFAAPARGSDAGLKEGVMVEETKPDARAVWLRSLGWQAAPEGSA
jgi:hypothetical protein